ncbi:hypothetical protein [Xanthomonas hortorum]|nr:hypothetical protein [Xanthomonas hortorum]MDV2452721.1 hypothetical protein [Xanthomonas hortorum NBC5720]
MSAQISVLRHGDTGQRSCRIDIAGVARTGAVCQRLGGMTGDTAAPWWN